MREVDFLTELTRRTGCGLLLDVNNVYVSATNHGYSGEAYLADFPLSAVGEIHLAGHAEDKDETDAPLLIDSHDRAVIDPVWDLYDSVLDRLGPAPSLVEWDSDLPDLAGLIAEAEKAEARLDRVREVRHAAHG